MPFLLLSCGAGWQTDVNTAVEQARTGQYKEAIPRLEAAVAAGNTDPKVVEGLYYSWIRTGEYAKAREKFDGWSAANDKAGPIRLAAGRVHRITGSFARAQSHLDAILNYADVGVAAHYEKAQVLESTGRREEAESIYEKLIENYQNGLIRGTDDLLYIAGALRAREYFYDANDILKLATEANPRNAEAFLFWGDLLADKFNEPEAIASYNDALKIDPNMPEAHLGMARLLALTEPEKSSLALAKALHTNPSFIEGHLMVAEQSIDSEQYDKAVQDIEKALAVNPQSVEAFSLLASIHFLRDNKAEFNRYVQKVLEANPIYSKLFYILAENCVSLRLYEQAVTFAKEALRLNPRDWKTMTLLGVNQLRLGDEAAGKATLEKAYEGDGFNVWTVNTLTLLDSFKNFDRFESPNFKVMLHKKESAALRPYVLDLLEKAYKDLSAKYEFKPNGPIVFEMYPDHADFAVRTLGLPGISAVGVSFGKMVAMDSPSARKPDTFNWAGTLWHEFMHVVTLQMTDHKIPRWFSEGLSVYEERKGFPGWGDDLKLEYLNAIKGKKLLSTAELNEGFIRPQFPEQVLVSYYQASLICDYIEQKYGFPAILRMLALYKEGKGTPDVFKEALKVDLAAFDSEFFKWVDEKIKGIDVEKFTKLMDDGAQKLAKGETDAAIAALREAVEMWPEYTDEHNAYEPLAEAYLKKGDKASAIDVLKRYLTYSETSTESHLKLAELLEGTGDLSGASHALQGAVFIRPLDVELHSKFGNVLMAQKQHAAAAREFETLIALGTPDRAGAYFKLAESQLAQGNRQDARKNILRCLEIAPSYEPAQELLLKIVR